MLWQWFIDNGIYILIALGVGTGLIIFTTRLSKLIASRFEPKNTSADFEKIRRILSSAVAIVLGLIIAFFVLSFIISRVGVDVAPLLDAVSEWFTEHGIILLVIILGAFLINKVIKLVLPSIVNGLVKARGKGRSAKEELKKRASTLSKFLSNVITVIIGIVAFFMLLSEIGIDIAPLLVGAGFIGIAVGFAGQKLISDILNGLFIVIEDYYRVGDVIKVASLVGVVEDVNIRRTIMRDLDGIVHIVPNSQIDIASNYTKNWARVNLNIPVAYGEDLEKVIGVLNRVGTELAKDEYFGSFIINAPQVLRVDNFGDSSIDIKVLGDTKPMRQWEIMGELRKRIKKAFDDEGIEIPWPHTKVYFGDVPWEKEREIRGKGFRSEKAGKQQRAIRAKPGEIKETGIGSRTEKNRQQRRALSGKSIQALPPESS